jgi:putative flippase GtrA
VTEEIGLTALPHARKPKLRMRKWIAKFVVVGGSGTVLNTAILYLLHQWLHVPLMAASAVAVEVAVVNNYLLHDRWTFATRSPSLRRFAKFNAASLGGLAVNVLVLWLLTRMGLHYLVANLIGIAAAFAVNCALSANWVWKGEKA